jgi:hypothetical protein
MKTSEVSTLNLYPQGASYSDSTQNSSSKSECKKKKPNVEPVTRAGTSTLSSLSNLPPLIGINLPLKQPTGSLPGSSQLKDIHQIKAMIDLGLGMFAHMNSVAELGPVAYPNVKKDYTSYGLFFSSCATCMKSHFLFVLFHTGL